MSEDEKTPQANLPMVAPSFTAASLGELAHEVAREINNLPDILKTFNMSQEQYDALIKNENFKQMLAAAVRQWKSADGTHKRLQLEAAASLEHILPTLTARLGDKNEPLPAVVEGAKFLAKTAGIDPSIVPNGPGSEKFNIVISIGDRKLVYENQLKPIEVIDASANPAAVPAIAKGDGSDPQV